MATATITADYLFVSDIMRDGKSDSRNMVGRSFADGNVGNVDGETVLWSVRDDDGIPYFEGIAEPNFDLENILDWAMADSGCTELFVWRDGNWRLTIG